MSDSTMQHKPADDEDPETKREPDVTESDDSQQEHHDPTTEEDTASGGAPEP